MTPGIEFGRKEAMAKATGLSVRTGVFPSDVFAIWRTSVEAAALEFASRPEQARSSKRRRLGFFAVPPRQRLHLAEMQQLERVGLRIVHVPSSLSGADLESISAYLSARLQKLRENTIAARPPRIVDQLSGITSASAAADEYIDDGKEDLEQLEALNDPDNAVDDLT